MRAPTRRKSLLRVGARRAWARARRQRVIDDFHLLYHYGDTWSRTSWLGHNLLKCPLDLWQYQDIIFTLRPDVIVETGTAEGGSALYMAQLCDLLQHGKVVTVDIRPHATTLPVHDRITYVTGSSTDAATVTRVREELAGMKTVLVILDSDHASAHVQKELELYSPFVTAGSYFIVEDTNVNGHPVNPRHGPGPFEAVQTFLRTHDEFQVDLDRQRYLLTQNPGGYLKRVR